MDKNKKLSYITTYVLLIVLYFILFSLINSGFISRYQVGILILILINVILAASLNVTVGCLGQITLGHAGFMSIGAYTAALLTKSGFLSGYPGYVVALIVGGLVAGVIGFIIGIPALRLTGDYLAIITLAFGEIIRVLIEYFKFTGGAQGLTGIPRVNNFTLIYFITIFSVIFMYAIMTSRHGRAILAIREDEIASGASGINTTYYKTFAFVLSAIFAGIAGGIYAAIVLTILPEVLRSFAEYRMIVYPLILIIMMLFRPKGLLGREEFQISKVISYFTKKRGETNGK